jgi:hypothetical protein
MFIHGHDRSGTALLDRMPGRISGYFSIGKLRLIWECGFGENQLCGLVDHSLEGESGVLKPVR